MRSDFTVSNIGDDFITLDGQPWWLYGCGYSSTDVPSIKRRITLRLRMAIAAAV
jgi:hypothetical protein